MIQNDKQHSDSGHSSFIHSQFTDLTWQQTVTQSLSQSVKSQSQSQLQLQSQYSSITLHHDLPSSVPQWCHNAFHQWKLVNGKRWIQIRISMLRDLLVAVNGCHASSAFLMVDAVSRCKRMGGTMTGSWHVCRSARIRMSTGNQSWIMNHGPWIMNLKKWMNHCNIVTLQSCDHVNHELHKFKQDSPINQIQSCRIKKNADYWLLIVSCNL